MLARLVSLFVAFMFSSLPAAAAAVELTFRVDRRANELWITDQLSGWDEGRTFAEYREALSRRVALNDARARLFGQYVKVRRAASVPPQTASEPGFPLGAGLVAPPTLPFEQFFVSCLSVPCRIKPSDAHVVEALLTNLRPQLTPLLDEARFLDEARTTLERLAGETRLADFLTKMARFYGVADPEHARFTVNILWAPDGHANATVYGDQIVLPISHRIAEDPDDLASWLGVIAHEVGHTLSSRLPATTRKNVTNALYERHGLVNERHNNIFDEATQTALGNIVFVRDHLPRSLDMTPWFYTWEPHNAEPSAIDSLARELEPVVRRHLDTEGAFSRAFLDDALAAYAKVFGNRPRHHMHVGLALAGKGVRGYLRGLAWSLDRTVFSLDNVAEFARLSDENPGTTRWIVLYDYEALPPVLERIRPAMGAALSMPSDKSACAWAKRRAKGRGYDFVLIARERDALRRLLLALFHDDAVKEAAPRCLP